MRWTFIFLIFSVSCNRIEVDYRSIQKAPSRLDPISNLDSLNRRKDTLPARSSQDEFQERFISSKLDMVFILDTHKTRESFYSRNFLGDNFLNYFYSYNWKLAWTDMSFDIRALQDETEEQRGGSKCSFFSNFMMTLGGVLSSSPGFASFGLRGLFGCVSEVDLRSNKNQNNSYANGSFLPFESDQKIYHLTSANPRGNVVLSSSLKLPNPKNKAYKAPLLRESESYPLLSMIASLSKNLYTQNSAPFFREDSLIVFVLFSIEDRKISISSDTLKESFQSVFGSYDRFKMILVTLTDESQIFCPLNFENSGKTPAKLIKLAKNLDQPVLDICSQDLGGDIFKEISKGLSSQQLL